MNYAPLNTKQSNYIRNSLTSWLSIAEGGKRAGKNIINIIAWVAIVESHPDKLHLAGGFTAGTARMNIIDSNGFGVQHIFEGRCKFGKYQGVDALYIYPQPNVEKIIVIAGGGKANDSARIKGMSFGSVYISEANECHPDFIKECIDRTLASSLRRILMDLNPKPPRHWFYLDIENHHREAQTKNPNYGYNYEHFTIADNNSLTREQLVNLLKTYNMNSPWFRADILGERTSASGIIYTGFSKSVEIELEDIIEEQDGIYDRKISFIDFSIGVDVGGTDATVATLNGFTSGYQQVIAIDGYYHKQGIDTGKDHATYAKSIAEFIKKWTKPYPRLKACTVFCESADKLFRQALRNALDEADLRTMKIVPSYKKEGIVDRIRFQEILINQGRKRIASHMRPWLDAYEQASWDVKEYQDKEWVRVDDGSYPVDCLDSDEYSIQPFKMLMLNGR